MARPSTGTVTTWAGPTVRWPFDEFVCNDVAMLTRHEPLTRSHYTASGRS
ncbi:MAG TPA: hypothetical protein VK908_15580 [Jiangellales bacterium]|nr:hypothetical protein [Jiangellales bacterium]